MALVSFGSNIFSLRAQRALSTASDLQENSAKKLASGSRIINASDDAAGLAVADGLRAKRLLYSTAIRNTNDGLSMLNIVDGSLNSQAGIVMRLAELAEQAASGTLSNTQRAALDREYQSLTQEFSRIADTTTFNGIKLLRGKHSDGMSSLLLQLGITGASASSVAMTTEDTTKFSGLLSKSMLAPTDGNGTIDGDDYLRMAAVRAGTMNIFDAFPSAHTFTAVDDAGVSHEFAMFAVDYADNHNFMSTYSGGDPDVIFAIFERGSGDTWSEVDGLPYAIFPGSSTYFDLHFNKSTGQIADSDKYLNATLSLESGVQVSINFDFSSLRFSTDPNATGSVLEFSNVRSQAAAGLALETDRNRLDELNRSRSTTGALMSRLRVASNVLSVAQENSAAAESRIRDVDVAEESANYTRLQILKQSAIAVLAQANQQPQILIDLLSDASN